MHVCFCVVGTTPLNVIKFSVSHLLFEKIKCKQTILQMCAKCKLKHAPTSEHKSTHLECLIVHKTNSVGNKVVASMLSLAMNQ